SEASASLSAPKTGDQRPTTAKSDSDIRVEVPQTTSAFETTLILPDAAGPKQLPFPVPMKVATVRVRSGEVRIGSLAHTFEGPPVSAYISDFDIDTTEVTNEAFRRFAEYLLMMSHKEASGMDDPNASWNLSGKGNF